MNLVWFLTIATILSLILGEFGQYPFSQTFFSISATDILLSLTIGLLLIWQIGIKRSFQIPNIFKLLILFWMVALFSLGFAGNFEGGLYLVRFILYSLSLILGYYLVKEKESNFDRISLVIILSGTLFLLAGFAQLIFYPRLEQLEILGYDPHQYRLVSTFLDPNFAGVFLNILFLLTLFRWFKSKRVIWQVLASLFLLGVVLTFSRSAYVMLIVQIFILGVIKNKKIILATVFVTLIIYMTVPKVTERINGAFNLDKSAQERVESWQKGIIIFQKNPVLGVGFNNLKAALSRYNLVEVFSKDGGHSASGVDSSILTTLATTGVLGLLVYLSFWIMILMKSLRAITKNKSDNFSPVMLSILIGLFVNSQFINSLFYPPNMLIIYLLVGSYYGSLD